VIISAATGLSGLTSGLHDASNQFKLKGTIMKKKLKNLAEVLFVPVAFVLYSSFFGFESITINGEQYGVLVGAVYGFIVVLIAMGIMDLSKKTYKAIK